MVQNVKKRYVATIRIDCESVKTKVRFKTLAASKSKKFEDMLIELMDLYEGKVKFA